MNALSGHAPHGVNVSSGTGDSDHAGAVASRPPFPPTDWDVATDLASRLVPPGPRVSRAERDELVAALRRAATRAPALVADAARLPVPASSPELVVDRRGWIAANARLLASVTDWIESGGERGGERGGDSPRGSAPLSLGQKVSSRARGAQLAPVLAALSTRVLGQYEPFLDAGSTAGSGVLYLVAPNILQVERELHLDPSDFRQWVCLHEQTHRVQFARAPWLVTHLFGLVTDAVTPADDADWSAADALADVVRMLGRRAAPGPATPAGEDSGVVEALTAPAARGKLRQALAVMALLEGHADVMMDLAGPSVIATLPAIRERFDARRQQGGWAGVLRRVSGMGAKLAQYRDGAAFCRGVIDAVGVDGFNAVFGDASLLPSPVEIHDPAAWVQRVHG